MTSATATAASCAEQQRDGERHARRRGRGRHVDADHHQARVGEVHDLGRLEHDDEAEREQRVHATEREPADEELEERVHQSPLRSPVWVCDGLVVGRGRP